MDYGFTKEVNLPYEQAIEKITEELKKEGFGILTTIDVKDTLKKKIGVDFNRYIILGACNPNFAYQALQAEENIGLLLPCNAIVYEKDGKTKVSLMNPEVMSAVSDSEKLNSIANQVGIILRRVMDNV